MQKKQEGLNQTGAVTLVMLVMLAVFFVFATGILGWALQSRNAIVLKMREMQAMQISEAGIHYYRWHLAHNESDYQDGNDWCCGDDDGDGVGDPDLSVEDCGRVCGPYNKVYTDYNGNDVGNYSLLITVPLTGSSVVGIESTGKTNQDNGVEKTIEISLAKKSMAEYSFLSNTSVWFGDFEALSGPLHSNGGIRMDGPCDAEITSAVDDYDCEEVGHDCEDWVPDTAHAPRIWAATVDGDCDQYWYPDRVPAKDFELFTLQMADIKEGAIEAGTYFGPTPSNRYGYTIEFDGNGGFVIKMVSGLCNEIKYWDDSVEPSIRRTESEAACLWRPSHHYDIPENGLIFVEDDLWISGEVKGRVTVAASRFDNHVLGSADIKINNNLTYDNKESGNDVLGLMAEGNIIVPQEAPSTLEIDAVMLSQNGHVYTREYTLDYRLVKTGIISVYGGIITNLFWTWTWVNSTDVIDGYTGTSLTYDNNLIFSPPPLFPSEDDFEIKSWSEKK